MLTRCPLLTRQDASLLPAVRETSVDEKLVDEPAELTPTSSRWSKKAIAFGASALLLSVSLLVFGGSKLMVKNTTDIETPVGEDQSEWLANAARATGDQYLLGVGKADITGYASKYSP